MKIKSSQFLIYITSFLVGITAINAKDQIFLNCQRKFLGGKLISDFLNEEKSKENPDASFISELNQLEKKADCLTLLSQAKLKGNGLLEKRNPLSSQILDSFVKFHQEWLTPQDFDQAPTCREAFESDVFDARVPSYHLTRALFQEDRKVSLAITAYGDLRGVRLGENPRVGSITKLTPEEYQKILGLDEPLDLAGDAPLIGFLYKKAASWSEVAGHDWSQTNKSWDQSRQKNKFRLYHHQGAGLLGSPSFLIHYAPKTASQRGLYKTNGKTLLPRKLAQGILRNVLCLDPLSFKAPHDLPEYNWNHPITKEKQCLNCHHQLDQMAAGMRHLTYLQAKKSCQNESAPQLIVPSSFETSYALDLWRGSPPESLNANQNEDQKDFAFSYPIGFFKGKRFVGFSQLGRVLSEGPDFYRCQVKKYFEFIHGSPIDENALSSLTKSYMEEQNGLTLLKKILSMEVKNLSQSFDKKEGEQ